MTNEPNPVPSEFTLLDLNDWLSEQSEQNPKFDEWAAHGTYINYCASDNDEDWDEYMLKIETDWGALLEFTHTQKDLLELLDSLDYEMLEATKVNGFIYEDDLTRKWKFSIQKMS